MSTAAQVTANRANAQHSTGPKTPEGIAASSRNNFRHGLSANAFGILDWESEEEFLELHANLRQEHTPSTPTEILLVESLAQHFWLMQRAMRLQDRCFHLNFQASEDEQRFALYLRYQTTHERAFHKCLNQLLKLRAEKRKQEIGFESQKRKQAAEEERNRRRQTLEERQAADHARREAAEKRKQDMHRFDIMLRQAEIDHQLSKTNMLQVDRIAATLRAEAAAEQPIRPQKAA